ncbi:MAG: cytochrome c peroxidase [Bacteroidota bacterium]
MRIAWTIFLMIWLPLIFSFQRPKKADHAPQINQWYSRQLSGFKSEVMQFEELLSKQPAELALQLQFRKTRIAFKKLAVLTDYFNAYETILINSPALERAEDDNPENILPPHGLQQMEAVIWGDEPLSQKVKTLQEEASRLLRVIGQLENEQDRINKFTDENVWYALRLQVIGITTKGITGFDSPSALYSLSEATASLTAIQELIVLYQKEDKDNPAYKSVLDLIAISITYLQTHNNFNSFDRLVFIKSFLSQISEAMLAVIKSKNFKLPDERRPLNTNAKNIFSGDAFDINFFSPNNRYQATGGRVALGKLLFYENRLSSNNTRSCASCHKPELAFTDGLKTAIAIDNEHSLKRNTPTLLNAVYQTRQFYDSRKTMLEFQIASVVHNQDEMGGSIEQAAEEIQKDSVWIDLFKNAYPGDASAVSIYTIANAIASYIRSLQSMHSRFDAYMRNENVTLTASEKNGFNLFAGKAKCATCHFMPLFNGLVPPLFSETESEVLGVPASLAKPAKLDTDSGKYYFTKSIVNLYSFKTPTIRNVALTAPYMHNGVYRTLEEVMDFYNDGGGKGLGIAPPNQTLPFDKLDLSKKEKKDIIAFMKTLTDTSSYKSWHR